METELTGNLAGRVNIDTGQLMTITNENEDEVCEHMCASRMFSTKSLTFHS